MGGMIVMADALKTEIQQTDDTDYTDYNISYLLLNIKYYSIV